MRLYDEHQISDDPGFMALLQTIRKHDGTIARDEGRICVLGLRKGIIPLYILKRYEKRLERILTNLEACKKQEQAVARIFPDAVIHRRTIYDKSS